MTGEIAYIALGANLGDRLANLRHAARTLAAMPDVTVEAASALYETAPVGGPEGQGAYLNAALRIRTTLAPAALLRALLSIESDVKRVRDVRWAPRTLDLDLLLYGAETVAADGLTVPHPRMHERRFVLAPLADVGADARHPALGRTVQDLLDALPPDDIADVVRLEEPWT